MKPLMSIIVCSKSWSSALLLQRLALMDADGQEGLHSLPDILEGGVERDRGHTDDPGTTLVHKQAHLQASVLQIIHGEAALGVKVQGQLTAMLGFLRGCDN